MRAASPKTFSSLTALVFLVLVASSLTVHAQSTIILVAPGGIQAPFNELLPRFESASGQKVQPTFAAVGVTTKKVLNGGEFDVAVVQAPYKEVVASGNVVPGSAMLLASVAVGVAVAHGSPKPDISTPDAVKRMLLAAKSVTCEMDVAGIDAIGPLPRQISTPTQLAGFVSAHAKNLEGARALLKALSAPDAAAAYKVHRMEPAH